MKELFKLLAEYGGTIESTGKMDEMNIKQARASGRMWVDEYGLGYVWMPGYFSNGPYPETVEEVQLFEKWFPLEVKLPEQLKNLDWMNNRKQPVPTGEEGTKPTDENWHKQVEGIQNCVDNGLLLEAGRFSVNYERHNPGHHPKTAAFHGFIAGRATPSVDALLDAIELDIISFEDDWSRNPQTAFKYFKDKFLNQLNKQK